MEQAELKRSWSRQYSEWTDEEGQSWVDVIRISKTMVALHNLRTSGSPGQSAEQRKSVCSTTVLFAVYNCMD